MSPLGAHVVFAAALPAAARAVRSLCNTKAANTQQSYRYVRWQGEAPAIFQAADGSSDFYLLNSNQTW